MIDIKRFHELEEELQDTHDRILRQSWLVHHIIGRDVSAYVYSDTYRKLTIGDTVEIQQEDTYRLGVYIYTSYYFVKKI